MSEPGSPTNRRAQRRKEERRLLWAVLIFVVAGGATAIAVAYGSRAAVLGTLCLLAGSGMLGVLWLILLVIERLAD